ncbi:protein translocase subunit SecD [Nocardia cyriacigeorgica]|uniref:Protein translocase subunit SecD n=1 Tax=Nocardia cyriacigeorgica TaxID=135487 RepID=A0A4U8VYF0_9NOCA|nr:protein translocase subunit SecD [Nocardia cyriacigeorgica]MBF6096934.1 protein translocase subunit SecD [Nocardia cyriacigeorgica]MBF6158409.1 protein translocase subunit SecD [Nocardia cyriacigeorgica]MBF6197902.1 protein translocase subunit SecD [Nocardia cyriacigeorgica]MBF6345775.1 protein translocase subunit SecD [Nocardia cyriacigeorgica]MBF6518569.1 protein translocase subunit SecD [Nocardia cyriacigeorgica]
MPPSQGSAHPFRLLGVYAALLAVIYALVFFTGDKSPTPKLGIDLQGGTRVTLTARTPDGSKPSQDSLKQAQGIIENRVNGLGVSGSEVVIDGDNLVITVPGDDSQQARSLATTAKLYIRPVLQAAPAPGSAPAPQPGQGTQPPATGTPAPNGTAPAPNGTAPAPATGQAPAAQNRVFPAQAPTEPAPSPAPTPEPASPADDADLTPQERSQQEIAAAKADRQSEDPARQQAAMAAMDCSKPDPLAGNDDPTKPLVTCSTDGTEVYLLGPSRIDGQEIKDATSGLNQQQARHEVTLEFKSSGSDAWADLTGEYVYKRVAFVLDSQVVSAPVVQQGPQQGGSTQISGNFTASSAKELANTLKYGSLPLSFQTSEAETVSATLGLSSLRAGLIAGAIGMVVVLLYCLLYYRMLGFLAGLSLVAAGVAVYGLIVLLGRWIGFTLDLAGIAGLIIGIGMTADSFVVFFERIKDEMREGRSFRSAVPRGWARAQRTNLSGKTVSLIAAVVLYILAAGQVKGFAFTLGLTTVLDVIVLYLVTAPLMMLASRSPFWAKPSVNGLGVIQQIARERGAGGPALVKETAR